MLGHVSGRGAQWGGPLRYIFPRRLQLRRRGWSAWRWAAAVSQLQVCVSRRACGAPSSCPSVPSPWWGGCRVRVAVACACERRRHCPARSAAPSSADRLQKSPSPAPPSPPPLLSSRSRSHAHAHILTHPHDARPTQSRPQRPALGCPPLHQSHLPAALAPAPAPVRRCPASMGRRCPPSHSRVLPVRPQTTTGQWW